MKLNCLSILFSGVIATTARKLDRENQSEHILEVSFKNFLAKRLKKSLNFWA
jgi:hypothetical protein